uniref:Ubiquitin-like domain-containing protein n=1 Tax=Mustela putorius furo TaxID=9669 RepID=M3Y6V2_MUSPF
SIHAQELHTLEVTSHVPLTKAHVASLEKIAPEDQEVLLAGTPLEAEDTLGQRGAEALTTLEIAGRMLGGKHGFLAHAGQVGVQTPKVAKQQKKKKRRWMQFNFVNVMPIFGKKKDPKANS